MCPEDEKLWDAVKKRVQKEIEVYTLDGLDDEIAELQPPSRSSSRSRSGRSDRSTNNNKRGNSEQTKSNRSRKSDDRQGDFLPPAPSGPVVGLGDHVPAFLQKSV